MINYLKINNYIIIDALEIEFSDGFNVITGETGAGKSIILGALKLLLGAKANADLIKKGTQRASIQAIFSLSESELKKLRESLDFDVDLDCELIISRDIMQSRSVCKLNGDLITRDRLKQLGEFLIKIHGQNDNRDLVSETAQRELLDDFIFHEDHSPLEMLKQAYLEYSELVKYKQNNDFDPLELNKKIEFIRFQMDEIDGCGLSGEDENVEAEFERLKNSVNIGHAIAQISESLSGEGGVFENIRHISHKLSDISEYYDFVQEDISFVDGFYYEMKEKLRVYDNVLEDLENESHQFEEVQRRFDEINSLKHKYGDGIDEILKYRSSLDEELDTLLKKLELSENIDSELEEKYDKVMNLAKKVSELRKEGAKRLELEISAAMQDLNFQDAKFEIAFESKSIGQSGIDSVSFLVGLNVGMGVAPIKEVASGGEISRIMLAIQSVALKSKLKPTIIFDEIDAGISGLSASAVAKRMHMVSRQHQVISVTHLAQVALYADEHFLIDKQVIDGNSKSNLVKLSEQERLVELARIMGGEHANAQMIQNAKKLRQKVLSEINVK